MSSDFSYADLIVLAAIAVFILLRLRSTLGKDVGFDVREHAKNLEREMLEKVVQLPLRATAEKQDPASVVEAKTDSARAGLKDIAAADPEFNTAEFLRGAKMAFEMLFDAFAKGDRDTLKMLLAEEVYAGFDAELKARATAETKTETTLLSVKTEEITEAALAGGKARITVLFATEQVTVTRNAAGDIVAGNPSDVEHDQVDWVFERDTKSKDPNWKVVET